MEEGAAHGFTRPIRLLHEVRDFIIERQIRQCGAKLRERPPADVSLLGSFRNEVHDAAIQRLVEAFELYRSTEQRRLQARARTN